MPRARLHAHRILGARLVDDVERVDAALRDALDLAGPARRHVAGLHPVMDHRTIELKGAGDIRLAAENLDQLLRAVHRPRLACQAQLDKPALQTAPGRLRYSPAA